MLPACLPDAVDSLYRCCWAFCLCLGFSLNVTCSPLIGAEELAAEEGLCLLACVSVLCCRFRYCLHLSYGVLCVALVTSVSSLQLAPLFGDRSPLCALVLDIDAGSFVSRLAGTGKAFLCVEPHLV